MYRIYALLAVLLCSLNTQAQIYSFVTHSTGTQTINGHSVTVTATNLASMYAPAYCGLAANSYYCGQGATALGFKYEFSPATNRIRMRFAGQNAGEAISFFV